MELLTTVQVIEQAIASGDVLTVRKLLDELHEAAEEAISQLIPVYGAEHEPEIRNEILLEVERIEAGFKVLDLIGIDQDGNTRISDMPLEVALEIAKKDEETTSQPADNEV